MVEAEQHEQPSISDLDLGQLKAVRRKLKRQHEKIKKRLSAITIELRRRSKKIEKDFNVGDTVSYIDRAHQAIGVIIQKTDYSAIVGVENHKNDHEIMYVYLRRESPDANIRVQMPEMSEDPLSPSPSLRSQAPV